MRYPLNHIISEIQKQERKFSAETPSFIDEAYKMTIYLQDLLRTVKEDVFDIFFSSKEPEYAMFRFTSIKGSCLASPRFWKKILPNGWRLFSKLA